MRHPVGSAWQYSHLGLGIEIANLPVNSQRGRRQEARSNLSMTMSMVPELRKTEYLQLVCDI